MDIIQIDSSESEDDFDISDDEALASSFNDDAMDRYVAQHQDFGVPNLSRPNSNGGDKTLVPHSSMSSPTSRMISSANLQNGIRDTGKSEASLEPYEGPIPVSKQHKPAEPNTWKNFESGDLDAKSLSEHSHRRTLPSSLHHGILPSSVINGKSLPDAKPKASTDIIGKGESYASSACSMKANAAGGSQRFPAKAASENRSDLHYSTPDSLRNDASDHKEKAATESRGEISGNSYDLVGATATDGSRRLLPSSFGNENAFKASRDARGKNDFLVKSRDFVGASASNSVHRVLPSSFMNEKSTFNYTPKISTESKDNEQVHGEVGTYRVLPPSLTHGRSVNGSQLVGARDAQSHPGLVEDRRIECDERLIYQEALQHLSQPKLEDDLPEGLLAVPLLKHQKIALAWMVQKENSAVCTGGILADDQGLGKTVSMIALIQKQRSQQSKFTSDSTNQIKPEALNLDEDDDGVSEVHQTRQFGDGGIEPEPSIKADDMASTSKCVSRSSRPAAGTLVVCPASVLRQWARELEEKVTDTAKLSVLIYHGGARTKNPADLAKYDVVLTTYTIVANEVPKQSVGDDDDEQRNLDRYGISSEFSSNKKRKQTSNGRSRGKKKGKGDKSLNLDLDGGPLARVRWFRVILDEAQTIKNHRTQVARACCGLRAKRRWCLSGTPIQNAIDDLYSYFRFLKYEPYCIYSAFCASIKYPISRDSSRGYKKLQAVLKVVLLRRTKGTLLNGEPILKLPPKLISMKRVEFSSEERAFYLRLEANSRQQFKEYAAAGTLKQNYANILLMLLRLRQACDHPLLVKGYHSNTIGKESLILARQLPRDMLLNLLNKLEGSLSICGVCSDTPEDAVVTMCGHVFCYQCVSEHLTGDDNFCPAAQCKDVLGTDSVFSRATLRSCISDEDDSTAVTSSSACDEESSISQSSYISSKIKAALDILNSILYESSETSLTDKDCNESDCCSVRTINLMTDGSDCNTNAKMPMCGNNCITDGSDSITNATTHTSGQLISNPKVPVKAIVFSQWTSMLDLLELSLNCSLIQYRRLDGTMSLSSRDRAVKEFNTDPEVSVMLMSLKAGNLGLNMTAACHVILLDLWWNPATEDQAVDRAHRIGQTRPVAVSRLTIKDTVEDRILALQEDKRKLVSSAFGEDQSRGFVSRLTVEDLRYLFMV